MFESYQSVVTFQGPSVIASNAMADANLKLTRIAGQAASLKQALHHIRLGGLGLWRLLH